MFALVSVYIKPLLIARYSFCSMPRPNLDELKTYLIGLGATEVVTEEFCGSHKMASLVEVRLASIFFSS